MEVGNRAKTELTFILANNMGSMVFIVPPLCITQGQLDEWGLRLWRRRWKWRMGRLWVKSY
ncbi:MAG: hypothetical protein U0X87_07885 [Anaerolineales bacterium]